MSCVGSRQGGRGGGERSQSQAPGHQTKRSIREKRAKMKEPIQINRGKEMLI